MSLETSEIQSRVDYTHTHTHRESMRDRKAGGCGDEEKRRAAMFAPLAKGIFCMALVSDTECTIK